MKTYSIIEGYFAWVINKDKSLIDSTKLRDFIEITDNNGFLEWNDVVEKYEFERDKHEYPTVNGIMETKIVKVKDYFYRANSKLENVTLLSPGYYKGLLIAKGIEPVKVNIKVKDLDLFEFLYKNKSDEGHSHSPVYFR